MAILQDRSYKVSQSEVEWSVVRVMEESISLMITLRSGTWPAIEMKINCLKSDFYKLLDDLRLLEHRHLSRLELLDPGLVIYHIPQCGQYYVPSFGLFQIPEDESASFYELIFMLDAGEANRNRATWRGPALSLGVTQAQIETFVACLKKELSIQLKEI